MVEEADILTRIPSRRRITLEYLEQILKPPELEGGTRGRAGEENISNPGKAPRGVCVCPGSEWGRARRKTQRRGTFSLGHHLPKVVVVVTDRWVADWKEALKNQTELCSVSTALL